MLHVDFGLQWLQVEMYFDTKQNNHSEHYSHDGACTNFAESFFSRMRTDERGIYKHISGARLPLCAMKFGWREQFCPKGTKFQFERIVRVAGQTKRSDTLKGYWRRRPKARERQQRQRRRGLLVQSRLARGPVSKVLNAPAHRPTIVALNRAAFLVLAQRGIDGDPHALQQVTILDRHSTLGKALFGDRTRAHRLIGLAQDADGHRGDLRGLEGRLPLAFFGRAGGRWSPLGRHLRHDDAHASGQLRQALDAVALLLERLIDRLDCGCLLDQCLTLAEPALVAALERDLEIRHPH